MVYFSIIIVVYFSIIIYIGILFNYYLHFRFEAGCIFCLELFFYRAPKYVDS